MELGLRAPGQRAELGLRAPRRAEVPGLARVSHSTGHSKSADHRSVFEVNGAGNAEESFVPG